MIPLGAKSAFFERIFFEILKLNTRQIRKNIDNINDISNLSINNHNLNLNNNNKLGTIREEHSVVNNNNVSVSNLGGNYQKEINKFQILSHFNKHKKINVCFADIPKDIIIKNLLFFLDINSLPKFSLVSKKANESVKTHIFIRLYFLNKEKKLIEQENAPIINSLEDSRKNFFEEYEMDPPNKEHAVQLMNTITNDDIIELKQCFKKNNKNYEPIIAPLVLLLGQKVKLIYN